MCWKFKNKFSISCLDDLPNPLPNLARQISSWRTTKGWGGREAWGWVGGWAGEGEGRCDHLPQWHLEVQTVCVCVITLLLRHLPTLVHRHMPSPATLHAWWLADFPQLTFLFSGCSSGVKDYGRGWRTSFCSELRSCVKVEVAVLALIVLMVSVDVKQHWTWTIKKIHQKIIEFS